MQPAQADPLPLSSSALRRSHWPKRWNCVLLFSPGLILLAGWLAIDYIMEPASASPLQTPSNPWAGRASQIAEISFAGPALLCFVLLVWWSRNTRPRLRRFWEIFYFSAGMFCLNFVAVFVVFLFATFVRHSL